MTREQALRNLIEELQGQARMDAAMHDPDNKADHLLVLSEAYMEFARDIETVLAHYDK